MYAKIKLNRFLDVSGEWEVSMNNANFVRRKLDRLYWKFFLHFLISGCNDNPTAQQYKSAYRKLLLHNDVISGEDANCLNDITQILEVSSGKQSCKSLYPNEDELEKLANFDVENQIDDTICEDIQIISRGPNNLQDNSTTYMAANLEQKVIRIIMRKGKSKCLECMQVFFENELTDDTFIQYKSETSDIVQPCKSTIHLIEKTDFLLGKYESLNISFNSVLSHIIRKIDISNLYEKSMFDEFHDHKYDLIDMMIRTYFDIKSANFCQHITRISQNEQIRHKYLKEIHFRGQ